MRGGGSVNADGFGLGWYADGQPVRYRRNVPIWADDNLPGLAGSIRSGAVIAAVRNGTDGMPLRRVRGGAVPGGNWFFSHNGRITGWPDSTREARRAAAGRRTAPARRTGRLRPAVGADPATAWTTGSPPADAVASVVQEVEAAAPGSRLNVLLTDGEQTRRDHLDTFALGPADRRLDHRQLGAVRPATVGRSTGLLVARGHRHDAADHPDGRTTRVTQIDVHLTPDHAARALREDARAGLTADPKWLPPKWFYDARGSELFEQITRLPEYYPTRAEREILQARAAARSRRSPRRTRWSSSAPVRRRRPGCCSTACAITAR